MAILIEEGEASEAVLAVYADIKATRKTDWVNNFWKALANHPATLKRIWENIKQVMAPGALDSLTKELVYIAVSVMTASLLSGQGVFGSEVNDRRAPHK